MPIGVVSTQPRRVLEALTGREPRLLADDAIAAHLFDAPRPSVMIQCRVRSWAVRRALVQIVIVYANT